MDRSTGMKPAGLSFSVIRGSSTGTHACLCPEGLPYRLWLAVKGGNPWAPPDHFTICQAHLLILAFSEGTSAPATCTAPGCLYPSTDLHLLLSRQAAEHGKWLRMLMAVAECLGSYLGSASYLLCNLG